MAWTAGTWTTGPYGVHTALDTNTIAWWQELPVRVVTAVLPWAVDRLVAARLAYVLGAAPVRWWRRWRRWLRRLYRTLLFIEEAPK